MVVRLFLALFFLSFVARGAEPQPAHVTTYTSASGELLDDFVVRISQDALRRSLSPGVVGEVCGEFFRSGSVVVLEVYTIRHLKECSYVRVRGRDYIGLTFHTHVWLPSGDFRRLRRLRDNPRFSESDYAHPGYLASGNSVLFHHGRDSVRFVR